MGFLGKLGSRVKKGVKKVKAKGKARTARKAKAAGKTVDQFKHDRKEKFKKTLSDTLGGGQRGLLTQDGGAYKREPATALEANKAQGVKDLSGGIKTSLNAIPKAAPILPGGGGPGVNPYGGGQADTPLDRTDMTSNASALRRAKKGW